MRLLTNKLKSFWYGYRQLSELNISRKAQALTYNTILTFFPFIVVVIYFLNLSGNGSYVVNEGKEYLLNVFFSVLDPKVLNEITGYINSLKTIPILNIILVFVGTFGFFHQLSTIINEIWEIEKSLLDKKRLILFYLSSLLIIPISFILLIFISHLVELLLGYFSLVLPLRTIKFFLFVFEYGLLLVFQMILPQKKISIKGSLISTGILLICIYILKYLFIFSVHSVFNYSIIYGSFSLVPLTSIWIYSNWYLILIFVVINKKLQFSFLDK